MKKNYCHIVVIMDKSGSMIGLKNDVISGFNKFIKDQKEMKGTATMTLIQFNDKYEVNYNFKNINKVVDLNIDTYIPSGMTAMYDAIGNAITSTGMQLSNMDEAERPDKVVVLIQTDGMENSSYQYIAEDIKEMIKIQTEIYSWDFVFLGANLDAKEIASNIGISKRMSMTFAANSRGMTSALNSVSENLSSYRSGVKSNMDYENKDYDAQLKAGVSQ